MRPITFLLALIIFCACNQETVDTKAEGEKLMALSSEWSKIAGTDSIERMLAYWADDATVMGPGQPPLKGKDAIREMVMGSFKIPGFKISWEPLSVTVSKSGDLAYMIEQNQITVNDSTGKPVTEYNKVVTIWRREKDRTWKNVVDMWNADPSRNK